MTKEFETEAVGKKGHTPNRSTKATKITYSEYNGRVAVFEDTLILTGWVYLGKHPKTVLKEVKPALYVNMSLHILIYTVKFPIARKEKV